MFTFLKNVFKKGELRQKVIFTLGILFVYRLGAAITIPSVNTGALSSSDATNGIFGIMNLLGGGTLERFSLFSLGVSPYITHFIRRHKYFYIINRFQNLRACIFEGFAESITPCKHEGNFI